MTRYAISLGSNLGDRLDHLRGATAMLEEVADLEAVSPLYETAPVGGPEQGPYLNAVVVIDSGMEPHRLLEALLAIEASHGREREIRWGPRTLDLDMIARDGAEVDDPPRLVLPHPRAAERRFVVEPLAAVWPDAGVGAGSTAIQAIAGVSNQDVDLLAPVWYPTAPARGRLWVAAQLVLFALIGAAMLWQGSLPGWVPGWERILGGSIGGLGLAVMIWAARSLGSSLTAVPEPASHGALIESGPYRLARHPIYTGVVLTFFGASVMLDAPVAAVGSLLLGGFFAAKSRYEERRLRMAYPGYRGYMERVGDRFVPHVF